MGADKFALTVTAGAPSTDLPAVEPVVIHADSIVRVGESLVFHRGDTEVYRCAAQALGAVRIAAVSQGSGDAARWHGSAIWDAEQDRLLLDLYAQGTAITELSAQLQRSHLHIINRLSELEQVPPLERDSEPWTAEEDEHLHQLRTQGLPLRQISGVLRRCPPMIQRHIADTESGREDT